MFFPFLIYGITNQKLNLNFISNIVVLKCLMVLLNYILFFEENEIFYISMSYLSQMNINLNELKKCPKCGEILPSSNFYEDITKNDNLSDYCKSCTKKYFKQF